jgi:hypothetical protein
VSAKRSVTLPALVVLNTSATFEPTSPSETSCRTVESNARAMRHTRPRERFGRTGDELDGLRRDGRRRGDGREDEWHGGASALG